MKPLLKPDDGHEHHFDVLADGSVACLFCHEPAPTCSPPPPCPPTIEVDL